MPIIPLTTSNGKHQLKFYRPYNRRFTFQGIAFMEAVVAPVRSWDRWPEQARQVFQALRSEQGEEMVLKNNFFVGQDL